MRLVNTKQIIKQSINCLNNIPPKTIQKAVILVCKDDDQHINLKYLIKDKFPELQLTPIGFSLSDGSTLIDPSQYIAYPEKDLNFIVKRYLAKYVSKVKFIFPISLSQISQISLMSMRSLFINFFQLFQDLDDLQMAKLAESCGIMALDIKNQEQQLLYKERLKRPNGLLQQGFIKDYQRNTQIFINTITSKDLIYGGLSKENIMEQFEIFLKKVDFFDYKARIKPIIPNKYFRYCEERLQISSIWHQLISFFYESIPLIIENRSKIDKKLQQFELRIYEEIITQKKHQSMNISYKLSAKQLQLLVPKKSKVGSSYTFLEHYQPKDIISPQPTLAIIYSKLIVLRLDLQINGQQVSDKVPGESKLMKYFLLLYEIGCISIDIYVFIASYFHIYYYLSTETNDHKNDLILKISLLQIKKEKDFSIIRRCIKLLLNQLQNNQLSMQSCQEITIYLKQIIDQCSKYKDKLAITSKILSNLQDHLANIYYKILKEQKNKNKYSKNTIHFLHYLLNCKEQHQTQKIEILKDVIQKLFVHQHSYKLGYQLACLLPQYEVQHILLKFYEDKIGLCPQRFKFIEQAQKLVILKLYYSDFANYLLKIGYHQKLRQLCISGLQSTRNIQVQQFFRIFLIKGQKYSEQEHQQFINSSILNKKKIVLSKSLIDKIQQQLLYLLII